MFKLKTLLSKLRNSNWFYKIFLQTISFFVRHKFDKVECFCLFIGYPRSGHTIIGALLDAHPEIVISVEADALGLLERGYSSKLIYCYILRRSKLFVRKLHATWTRYSYQVPGLYQGDYEVIRLIGDKKGAKTTNRLMRNFDLLDKLEELLNVPVKMIHVVRNPLDNIATILLRDRERGDEYTEELLKRRIDYFFANADLNLKIILSRSDRVITIYHEEFVEDPKKTLQQLLTFFNIKADMDYLEKCSNIVKLSPNITRNLIDWPDELRKETLRRMKNYPFFVRYT
jgi:hypothetical protein